MCELPDDLTQASEALIEEENNPDHKLEEQMKKEVEQRDRYFPRTPEERREWEIFFEEHFDRVIYGREGDPDLYWYRDFSMNIED